MFVVCIENTTTYDGVNPSPDLGQAKTMWQG